MFVMKTEGKRWTRKQKRIGKVWNLNEMKNGKRKSKDKAMQKKEREREWRRTLSTRKQRMERGQGNEKGR